MTLKLIPFLLFFGLHGALSQAQVFDVEQLILDAQKLSELKSILSELKTGYQILNEGYETIRTLAESNFNLHQSYLNSLLAINPAVRNYQRVADIVSDQASMVSGYTSAMNRFKQDKHFTPEEISYFGTVYAHVLSRSLNNIKNLTQLLTPDLMRMSDEERLHAIDVIYADTRNQLFFVRSFNNSTTLLAIHRATEQNDAATALTLYGMK